MNFNLEVEIKLVKVIVDINKWDKKKILLIVVCYNGYENIV